MVERETFKQDGTVVKRCVDGDGCVIFFNIVCACVCVDFNTSVKSKKFSNSD